ncbi:glycosyltransferase family 2 protein [Henriciella sp.]|uniref:glycosyltransferase family 2 protein n=1 Tax=Henriciella sp. TaxID=1968823 RepID=UPI002617A3D8|nr:glycosyltransferase family 2 protein [Henriciella sp.]
MGDGAHAGLTVIPFAREGTGPTGKSGAGGTLGEAIARSEALPPELSARKVLSAAQKTTALLILSGGLAAFVLQPYFTSLALRFLFWSVFFLIVSWRFGLAVAALSQRLVREAPARHAADEEETELPVYSVLIALRDEAGMMRQLAESLSRLDWPADRLEIFLLVEEDDPETREAAETAMFPAGTHILTVPAGVPLTKPRALNYGLARARGRYVTIYDAEDRPGPQQLKQAHEGFRRFAPDVVCLQAPLVATNGASSWIASQWALEYAVQFGLYVPALSALEHPVMLGGTSNHFLREDLVSMGGWDAWNVTEDADLGIRAARLGARTRTITSPTLESAPESFSIWLKQRGRWIKGYMQTWLVCMRKPVSLVRELGLMRSISLQLTLGGSILNAFLYGPMTIYVVAGLVFPDVRLDTISFALFSFGWFASTLCDFAAPGRWSFTRVLAALTRPLYWPLQTLAAVNAVYGLAVKPFFWAKTPHRPEEEAEQRAWQAGSSQLPS